MLDIRDLYGLTITNPAEAARRILRLHLSPGASVAALTVALILGVVLSTVIRTAILGPGAAAASPAGITFAQLSPLGTLAVTATAAGVFAAVIWLVGYAFGGKGNLFPIVALMAWCEFFNVTLQAIAIVVGLVVPLLGALVVLITIGLMLRTFVYFIQVVHGFDGVGRAAAVFLCAVLLGAFVLSNLALFTGIVQVEVPA